VNVGKKKKGAENLRSDEAKVVVKDGFAGQARL
jgi:hypothetical protein